MSENRVAASRAAEVSLFLRRWIAHPLRVAAILPSSDTLSALVARHAVRSPDEIVVEVGAGTGVIGQALVAAGLSERNLAMVELDEEMGAMLKARLPRATTILGDATRPASVIPRAWHGRIGTCISGLPLLQLPFARQQRFVDEIFQAMAPGAQLIQYSNMPVPPLPHRRLGLKAKRLGLAWTGPVPGFVWRFTQTGADRAF